MLAAELTCEEVLPAVPSKLPAAFIPDREATEAESTFGRQREGKSQLGAVGSTHSASLRHTHHTMNTTSALNHFLQPLTVWLGHEKTRVGKAKGA